MQKPLALEMVLCDERGGKIHVVVRRTLVYKFQSTLIEGAAYSISNFGVGENSGEFKYSMYLYKINFEYHTRVVLMRDCTIPRFQYSFVSLADIMAPTFDNSYLVDIMGVLTGIGTEKESKIECALFENYLDDLNAFLACGNTTNVVVVVQLAKVKSFKGKVSLQNALHATKLFFNPDFEKAVELRKSQIAEAPKMSPEEEFLTHTIMKTIEELKDSNEEFCCIVMATIKHLIHGEDWCIRLADVAHVASILDISCSDLLESNVQPNDKHFPPEISALVDKTFLFKVENKIVSNSRFETSYKNDDSLDYVIPEGQLMVGGDLSNDLQKEVDLMSRLSDSVNDDENNIVLLGTADGEGLTMDSDCIAPCKRNSADSTDDPILASSSIKLKKVIKQEKD
ncbi:Nucleic acid-binding, OB-fold [Sesbania bispinosa]|nr:Nucleic acid-binding, OB-fold [Sesbania bispinosa]